MIGIFDPVTRVFSQSGCHKICSPDSQKNFGILGLVCTGVFLVQANFLRRALITFYDSLKKDCPPLEFEPAPIRVNDKHVQRSSHLAKWAAPFFSLIETEIGIFTNLTIFINKIQKKFF